MVRSDRAGQITTFGARAYIQSPPQQILDPVPQVVHLKSAPRLVLRSFASRQLFLNRSLPLPKSSASEHLTILNLLRRVGTAKLPVEDKLDQIINIGVPAYPEPPYTPQVICVGVQPPKEVAKPQVVCIGTPGGVPPAPQVIHIAAPYKEAPPPVEVVRIGSPTTTLPLEPPVIRVTSPPVQAQEPTPVVQVGSAIPRDVGPQLIHVKSPERPPAPTEIIRVGTTTPTSIGVASLTVDEGGIWLHLVAYQCYSSTTVAPVCYQSLIELDVFPDDEANSSQDQTKPTKLQKKPSTLDTSP
ncbi:hypothetical protein RSOLAG22IIIB_08880 [Rhizoctonia solani]|uniref:Uncharacterized protein n=1 Tax=Rhizoctonia solani TaxID=456999 RepID=A0A0K6FVK9_9AGAM|nr:hypothetical protein RSOLAG22IIIB_08880 [Rhizoctonia solani]